jgi:hypothetical protein
MQELCNSRFIRVYKRLEKLVLDIAPDNSAAIAAILVVA